MKRENASQSMAVASASRCPRLSRLPLRIASLRAAALRSDSEERHAAVGEDHRKTPNRCDIDASSAASLGPIALLYPPAVDGDNTDRRRVGGTSPNRKESGENNNAVRMVKKTVVGNVYLSLKKLKENRKRRVAAQSHYSSYEKRK